MDLIEAIYSRRAVRQYEPRPLTREAISSLIDAAIHAPSAMNRQPWAFTVVQDRRLLAQLSEQAKAFLAGGAGEHPELSEGARRLLTPSFDIFYGAPVLIVICAIQPDAFAAIDCSLAAENLMLAARARGLGSCWIGFAEMWLSQPEGKAMLGIPDSHTPVAPIIVGWPRGEAAPTPRRPPQVAWIGG
jgi:nitroreductase